MPINDTFELAVRGTVNGQAHIHTLHFRSTDGTQEADGLAADWQTSGAVLYRAMFQTSDLPVELVAAKKVCGGLPLPGPVEVPISGAARQGTRSSGGAALPSFTALAVREKGALAGRSRSGRFFISGQYTPDLNGQQWSGGYLSIVQAYVDALVAQYVTGSPPIPWMLVTHSRKLAAPPSTLNCQDSSTRVASLIVNPNITTMRSRKAGHGS